MYCGNCGFPLSDDSIFCTRCGTRLRPSAPVQPVNEPIAPVSEQTAPVEQAAVNEQQAPVNEQPEPVPEQANANERPEAAPNQTANEQPFAPEQQTMTAEQAEQPAVPEKQPEKEFFGKGAFAFCLVVIAILAIACGIFAELYFSGASKPTAGAVARDNIIRDYFDDNYEGGFIEW